MVRGDLGSLYPVVEPISEECVADTKTLCTWAEFDKHYKKAFVERIVPFIQRMGG